MKKQNHGCLIVIAALVLVIAGAVIGVRMWNDSRLKAAAAIDCPVFDTAAYTAGTALAGRDLGTFAADALSARHDIRYGFSEQGLRFTDLVAESFPGPFALLLKPADGGEPVFCKPEGLDVAESLAGARTLIYAEQTGPFDSAGHRYCTYRARVFTLDGRYYTEAEDGRKILGDTVTQGLVLSAEAFGIAEAGAENPLERYAANYELFTGFDYEGLFASAVPAEDASAIPYRIGRDESADNSLWRSVPCYDLSGGGWNTVRFELNGPPMMRVMTSEVSGRTPLAGSYAGIGTAYIQTLRIRVYDCENGTYVEFPWHDSAEARPHVSNVVVASYAPEVYCPAE